MKNRTVAILNALVLVLISLTVIQIATKYLITPLPQDKTCNDASLYVSLKFEACYDFLTNNTFIAITRGHDRYKIKEINVSFQERKFIIINVPEPDETTKYKFNLEAYPKKMGVLPVLDVDNICQSEKLVSIGYCSSKEAIFANFTGKDFSTGVVESGGETVKVKADNADILSQDLVEKEKRIISDCKSEWECDDWGECINGVQKRECTDKKRCFIPTEVPDSARTCKVECKEEWKCEWSDCIGGYTTPSCTDIKKCGTDYSKPKKLACVKKKEGKCEINISCSDWTECRASYNFESLLKGVEQMGGTQSRICKDKSECIYPFIEDKGCPIRADITTEEVKWCGRTYLGVFDKLDKKLIARLERPKNNVLNLNFMMTSNPEKEYCEHCFNMIRDGDEAGIDCGGSCKECD
jgi:hypothetical protein